MISMRYAWNLAHGKGLVWNPGERVEGFTNPLWVFFMALATRLFSKAHAVLAIQIFGATLLALAGWIAGILAADMLKLRKGLTRGITMCAAFSVVTAPFPLRFWSDFGMEVSLLLVLSTLSILIASRVTPHPGQLRLAVLGVIAAVAYAARPDGILVVLPALALAAWRARGFRAWAALLVPPLVVVIAMTLFRRFYFGDWLPNTYRLKMLGMPLRIRLENGVGYVTPFLEQTWPLYVIGALAVAIRRDGPTIALFALSITVLGYQVYVGGDSWGYWRQLSPALPALSILATLFLVRAIEWLREGHWLGDRIWIRNLAAWVFVWMLFAPMRAAFADEAPVHFNVTWNKANTERAFALQKLLGPNGRIALLWAGATAYYSGQPAIDMLGKCDRHVARMPPDLSGAVAWAGMTSVPGHNKSDLNYSLEVLRADYTEALDWGSDHVDPKLRAKFRARKEGDGSYLVRTDFVAPAPHR
jgi:hypothetical protein